MDALVNYISDDEPEEIMVDTTAERRNRGFSPGKPRHSYSTEAIKNHSSSGGGRRETSTSRNNNYRDESSQRQKSVSYGNNNRSETSSNFSRENTREGDKQGGREDRGNRDTRDSRETRDSRANLESRDTRDNRVTRESRDIWGSRETRETWDNRETRETRDTRDSSRDKTRDRRSDNWRENRDNTSRDYRNDEREQKDKRSAKDSSRYENKSDRPRSTDNKNEYNRERDNNLDNRRPPRDGDDHIRSPSALSYKNNRTSDASTTPSTFRQPNQNRSSDYNRHSADHRDRAAERSGSRNRRRSKSCSRSPTPSHYRHRRNKRSSIHDDKNRSRRRSQSRSRSRTRSRSPRSITPKRLNSRERESYALEQARKTALEMESKIYEDDGNGKDAHTNSSSSSRRIGVRNDTEALLSLPLSETAPKQPNVIAVAPVSASSNSEPAIIQLPSYYNPNVINPNRYAEQVQKRKLLWGAKKAEDTAKKWGNAQFSQDTDGKVASKFMRLMGIKGNVPPPQPKAEGEPAEQQKNMPSVAPDVKTRQVMFSNMEQQYEVARQVTHTMRGVGLGFSSQPRPF